MKKKKKTKFNAGLKAISRQLSIFKKDVVIMSLMGTAGAIAHAITPYIMGRILDATLSPNKALAGTKLEMPLWLLFVIAWTTVEIFGALVSWRIRKRGDYIGERLSVDYRIKGFSHLLELPMSFHKRYKVGQVGDKINRAANYLQSIFDQVIIDLFPQFLSIIVALIIVFAINPVLASILVIGLATYVIVLIKKVPHLTNLADKMHKSYSRAFGDAYDTVFNVKAIKQSVSEKYEQKKIKRNFWDRAAALYLNMIRHWQYIGLHRGVTITVTQAAILIVSILSIRQGTMTIGGLVMFTSYSVMVFQPFKQLANHWRVIQNGLPAIEQAEKILNTPTEKYKPKKERVLERITGEVEFKNVSFSYDTKKPILRKINFRISPGETMALVGESGVGKSTLIDLISGYNTVSHGEVLLNDENIQNISLEFLRSNIAVVPQEVVLFNDTIKNNIKYGNFKVTDEEVKEAARQAHCLEFIQKFPKKWNQLVGERGVKLSVGQKQRVSIARAILRNPRILILDEPTSALDAKSEKIIQEALEKLMKGRTTFIIAHRLSTVRKANKILVIKDGKIIEQGTHKDLTKIKGGAYRELYELQIGLHD